MRATYAAEQCAPSALCSLIQISDYGYTNVMYTIAHPEVHRTVKGQNYRVPWFPNGALLVVLMLLAPTFQTSTRFSRILFCKLHNCICCTEAFLLNVGYNVRGSSKVNMQPDRQIKRKHRWHDAFLQIASL